MTGLEMIEDRVDIRSGMRLYCGGERSGESFGLLGEKTMGRWRFGMCD